MQNMGTDVGVNHRGMDSAGQRSNLGGLECRARDVTKVCDTQGLCSAPPTPSLSSSPPFQIPLHRFRNERPDTNIKNSDNVSPSARDFDGVATETKAVTHEAAMSTQYAKRTVTTTTLGHDAPKSTRTPGAAADTSQSDDDCIGGICETTKMSGIVATNVPEDDGGSTDHNPVHYGSGAINGGGGGGGKHGFMGTRTLFATLPSELAVALAVAPRYNDTRVISALLASTDTHDDMRGVPTLVLALHEPVRGTSRLRLHPLAVPGNPCLGVRTSDMACIRWCPHDLRRMLTAPVPNRRGPPLPPLPSSVSSISPLLLPPPLLSHDIFTTSAEIVIPTSVFPSSAPITTVHTAAHTSMSPPQPPLSLPPVLLPPASLQSSTSRSRVRIRVHEPRPRKSSVRVRKGDAECGGRDRDRFDEGNGLETWFWTRGVESPPGPFVVARHQGVGSPISLLYVHAIDARRRVLLADRLVLTADRCDRRRDASVNVEDAGALNDTSGNVSVEMDCGGSNGYEVPWSDVVAIYPYITILPSLHDLRMLFHFLVCGDIERSSGLLRADRWRLPPSPQSPSAIEQRDRTTPLHIPSYEARVYNYLAPIELQHIFFVDLATPPMCWRRSRITAWQSTPPPPPPPLPQFFPAQCAKHERATSLKKRLERSATQGETKTAIATAPSPRSVNTIDSDMHETRKRVRKSELQDRMCDGISNGKESRDGENGGDDGDGGVSNSANSAKRRRGAAARSQRPRQSTSRSATSATDQIRTPTPTQALAPTEPHQMFGRPEPMSALTLLASPLSLSTSLSTSSSVLTMEMVGQRSLPISNETTQIPTGFAWLTTLPGATRGAHEFVADRLEYRDAVHLPLCTVEGVRNNISSATTMTIVAPPAIRAHQKCWAVRWDALGLVPATRESSSGDILAIRSPAHRFPMFGTLIGWEERSDIGGSDRRNGSSGSDRGVGAGRGVGGGRGDEGRDSKNPRRRAHTTRGVFIVRPILGVEDRFLHLSRDALGTLADHHLCVNEGDVLGVVNETPRDFEQLVRFHLYDRAKSAVAAHAGKRYHKPERPSTLDEVIADGVSDSLNKESDCNAHRTVVDIITVTTPESLPLSGFYLMSCASPASTIPYYRGVPHSRRHFDAHGKWPYDCPADWAHGPSVSVDITTAANHAMPPPKSSSTPSSSPSPSPSSTSMLFSSSSSDTSSAGTLDAGFAALHILLSLEI
jgi:hypothetical protein